jgi:hypothetical protein
MDMVDQMAADIAMRMNGGEWTDGKWYSQGHRDAWVKAVQPYADEIERLRDALRWAAPYVKDDPRVSKIVEAALKEKE